MGLHVETSFLSTNMTGVVLLAVCDVHLHKCMRKHLFVVRLDDSQPSGW